MAKNRLSIQSKQTPAMSSSHSHTVDNEDEDEICPVCDGECTCSKSSSTVPPLSMAELSLQYTASHTLSSSQPSLKIKLTIPPSLLGKRRANLIKSIDTSQPKKRGRPPKSITPIIKKKLKQRATTIPAATKRRRIVHADSSDLSDTDHRYDPDDDEDDDDAESVQFPTFVSASVLSSIDSDNSESSSLSDFDSDSSIEAEEEQFIVSQLHDKARLRRELLGDEAQKKRSPQNDWVIRPRKKSVGPSDAEMDVDSDATEDDDDDDDDEEEEEEEEEETDGRIGAGYVGLATGWSEDDESSFDADLFFANLSDTHSSSSSTQDNDDDDDETDDQSDLSVVPRQDIPNLPFEVADSWDGQIVFTNGLSEGQGILDIDFEVNASQFAPDPSDSQSRHSDGDMSGIDDGYEQDEDGGDGDTTDEELVGDDHLPNERAMRLFHLPLSVSAINPLSTVSPAVSPGPRNRIPFHGLRLVTTPSDILSGKTPFRDEDDLHDDDMRPKSAGPRRGIFVPVQEVRQVVIDGSRKDLPSPHPRFNRRRATTVSHNAIKQLFKTRSSSIGSSSTRSPLHLLSSDDLGSEPIELDDVLEASFLDHKGSDNTEGHEDERKQNLTRWDLISVGAFRQTRENVMAEGSGGAAAGAGWSSDAPGSSTDYGNMLKPSPIGTMLWSNKNNISKSRKRLATPNSLSPDILPVRDGDRTPTSHSPPNYQTPQQNHKNHNHNHHHHSHSHKTRKELRRERKLKRKSYGPQQQQQHQHHHHHHHPNSKMRSASSAQRAHFSSSSVPPLNL